MNNLAESMTLKNLAFIALAVYLIIWLERFNNRIGDSNEITLKHERERIEMLQEISKLNLKVNYYENKIINNSERIDGLNNAQLDSLWSSLNP